MKMDAQQFVVGMTAQRFIRSIVVLNKCNGKTTLLVGGQSAFLVEQLGGILLLPPDILDIVSRYVFPEATSLVVCRTSEETRRYGSVMHLVIESSAGDSFFKCDSLLEHFEVSSSFVNSAHQWGLSEHLINAHQTAMGVSFLLFAMTSRNDSMLRALFQMLFKCSGDCVPKEWPGWLR